MSCYSGQYDIKLGLSSAKSHEKKQFRPQMCKRSSESPHLVHRSRCRKYCEDFSAVQTLRSCGNVGTLELHYINVSK